MRTKVASFFIFFQELSNKKKIKALRPKMTKIASRGGGPALSKRESCWAKFLADFHFSTHHISGKDNPADPLSRQVNDSGLEMNNIESSIGLDPDFATETSEGYGNDPELSHIIKRLKNSSRDVFHERYFWDERKQRLYLIESSPVRLCVPCGQVQLRLMQENHDCPFSGHPGRDRTLWNFFFFFFFASIYFYKDGQIANRS